MAARRNKIGYKTVSIRTERYEALRLIASTRGTSLSKVVDAVLKGGSDGGNGSPLPTQIVTSTHTHDQCAEALLKLLPPTMYTLAMEVCQQILGIRPWQLIVGHLQKAADRGELPSPLLDSRWDHQPEQLQSTAICEREECKKSFTPKQIGERFCGPICGGKAAGEALQAAREKAIPRRDRGMEALVTPGTVIQ